MRVLAASVFLGAVLILAGASARAEEPKKEAPPKTEGSAEVGYVSTTGNSSTRAFNLGGELIHRPDPWLLETKVRFVRNEDDVAVTAQSLAALFRASRKLNDRLSAFGQYDYLRDVFAGIEHRNTTIGGLSYLLLDAKPHTLRAGAGVGYIREQRLDADTLSTASANLGLAYAWTFSETARFTDDFRTDYGFASGAGWRIEQVAALTATLTKRFSLKVSNTVRYASEPVPGFEATDTITALALVAKF